MGDLWHWHGKIVRVYPERYRPGGEADGVSLSLEEMVEAVVGHARDRGYASGDIAKVVMVSRFGDVGITKILDAQYGYDLRLFPECLEEVPAGEAEAIVQKAGGKW